MGITSKIAREVLGGAFTKESVETLYRHPQVVANYDQDRFSSFQGRLKLQAQLATVVDWLEVPPGSQVLDLATGTGRFVKGLAQAFPNVSVVGVDLSAPMLRQARKKLQNGLDNAFLINADAFRMPFSDGAFDNVVAFLFLQHFDDFHRGEIYAEITRLLKPGGALMMNAPNREYHKELVKTRPVYDAIYRLEDLRAELRNSGFRMAGIRGVPLHPWHLHCALRHFRRIPVLRKSELAQMRIALFLTRLLCGRDEYIAAAPEWIVKCRKLAPSS